MKRTAYVLLIASALIVACEKHPDDVSSGYRPYAMTLDTVQGHVYLTTMYYQKSVNTLHAAHCGCQTKGGTP